MAIAGIMDDAKSLPTPATAIDARPALPVSSSEESLWDKAAEQRDWMAAAIEQFFRSRGVTPWVRKSAPGAYPLFVAVDSWMPIAETDIAAVVDRTSLSITIAVAPYLESKLTYKIELNRHSKKLSAEYWELSEEELREVLVFLLEGGKKPAFFCSRVPFFLTIIGAFIPFVGRAPENKLIEEARPHFWTLPTAVCTGSLLLGASILASAGLEEAFGLVALIVGGGATSAFVMASRRPVVQAIPKQSLRSPRREYRIDSWHVSVPGAGMEFEAFKRRIQAAAITSDPSIEANVEVHQNATPRGFEERERLVLSKGQTTLHIHVYPFAQDAFVGWDSHLNWRRWTEGGNVSRTVREKRCVEYKALDVGVHIPTEFDLIEADVLAETTHRRIVDEIKLFLKEREIEADLDFKIIRGDRGKALDEEKDTKKSRRGTLDSRK